jgi:transcriptional regulator with XRE-family HTH domain
MITGAQIRSARHALKYSAAQLSKLSNVSVRTIKRMEADDGIPNSTMPNILAVKSTLEAAGIEFIGMPDDAPGIRIHGHGSNA